MSPALRPLVDDELEDATTDVFGESDPRLLKLVRRVEAEQLDGVPEDEIPSRPGVIGIIDYAVRVLFDPDPWDEPCSWEWFEDQIVERICAALTARREAEDRAGAIVSTSSSVDDGAWVHRIEVGSPIVGKVDDQPVTVNPGSYIVVDRDRGDLWIVHPDVDDMAVLLTPEAMGRVECPACTGRGSHAHREADGTYDTIECDVCAELGSVTPEQAAAMPRYPWEGA